MPPQTDAIIVLIVIPLVAGLLLLTTMNLRQLSRCIGVTSFLSMIVASAWLLYGAVGAGETGGSVLVTQMGAWPAPFGITLVFDSFSGLLVFASAMVGFGAYLHAFNALPAVVERRYFHPLIQFLMMGVNQSFLTGDLFNLFVAFEIMLLASYSLLLIGGGRAQLAQGYKYVLLNLLASAVFVLGAAMVYGMFGTLNMAELARIVLEARANGEPPPTGFTALGILFLLVFGLKGAFFPMWFWLPDTYWTCPISIAGLFGGMLTKVGVYAVARTFPMFFAGYDASLGVIQPLIAVSAAFTMFLAVLGAVSHHHVRRILAVHVISQVGYMVFGIAVMTGTALAGVVFYMIQHMVVKCSLFLCCGAMERHSGTDDLERQGGLLKRDVWLGVLFFVAAMSLVGLPPLSGFFGKLTIIRAGWTDYWWLSILGLLTGGLTLLSMMKIWSYGFWNPPASVREPEDPSNRDDAREVRRAMPSMYLGITVLVAFALYLGFGAELVYDFAWNAGNQLIDPRAYIEAVLGHEAVAQLPGPDPATLADRVLLPDWHGASASASASAPGATSLTPPASAAPLVEAGAHTTGGHAR